MSNTKLNRDEKEYLRELKTAQDVKGGELFFYPDIGFTVAVLPAGDVCRVATYVSSPLEQKFRRKVGAFNALCRLMDDEFILIPLPDGFHNWAEQFAQLCAEYQA